VLFNFGNINGRASPSASPVGFINRLFTSLYMTRLMFIEHHWLKELKMLRFVRTARCSTP